MIGELFFFTGGHKFAVHGYSSDVCASDVQPTILSVTVARAVVGFDMSIHTCPIGYVLYSCPR
jgi:hypothetical protein